jgi:hypothetical protein
MIHIASFLVMVVVVQYLVIFAIRAVGGFFYVTFYPFIAWSERSDRKRHERELERKRKERALDQRALNDFDARLNYRDTSSSIPPAGFPAPSPAPARFAVRDPAAHFRGL